MYPAFVNCTTIDWFSEWPNDALLEVAEKYLETMDLGDDEVFGACIIYTLITKHRTKRKFPPTYIRIHSKQMNRC